jgi:uncharacterized protein (DUF1684 family)
MRRFGGVLALALLAGCAEPHGTLMIHVPPPADWEARIAAARTSREDYFRHGADSPLPEADRAGFTGLDYWPLVPELYRVGTIERDPAPQPLQMVTTAGDLRPAERVGALSFEFEGRRLRLQVYRLTDREPAGDVTDFFLPFKDATSGVETYPAGRYVDLQGPRDGPYVLDFNTAYNPSCAYGAPERFACPATPSENALPVRIEAGERGYRERAGR